jgi:hypothetical protein
MHALPATAARDMRPTDGEPNSTPRCAGQPGTSDHVDLPLDRFGVSASDAAARAEPSPERVVSLWLVLEASLDVARVPGVLGASTAAWLGELASEPGARMRSFVCDLELHAGKSERVLFRKAAIVSFGEPTRDGDGWVVDLEWRAATLTPLFPVFAGQLHIEPTRIVLDGRYAPPGGTLGYLLDTTLLGTAARQTGHWFLRKVADALT